MNEEDLRGAGNLRMGSTGYSLALERILVAALLMKNSLGTHAAYGRVCGSQGAKLHHQASLVIQSASL